jgi:MscS family membrane protein
VIDDLLAWLRHAVHQPWAITIGVVVAAFIAGRILVRVARPLLGRIAGRTSAVWDDRLVELMSSPLSLVLALQALHVGSNWFDLEAGSLSSLHRAIAIVTTLAVLWTAFRAIDLGYSVLERRSWAIDRPASRSVLAIGSRLAKVAVILIGGIVALAQLGVSVASLVAGLGIGGLAVALAAQKTLENLFGTLSIGVDQPMREGDVIKVYDLVGTVERIGLRSTRLRTPERTVVTIPNGDLSNQRIESFAVRDRLRLATTIGLVYDTTAQQLRTVLGALEAILQRHPKVAADSITVRLKELGATALNIDVNALFETSDGNEFQAIRQDILLDFVTAIEAAGSAIAVPTRTVQVGPPGPRPERADGDPGARP